MAADTKAEFGSYGDLAYEVIRLSQGSTNSAYDIRIAGELLNEAYLSVCNNGDPWDFLYLEETWTPVAGQDTYDFTEIATQIGLTGATIEEIHSIVNASTGDGMPLEAMSWQDLESAAFSTQQPAQTAGSPIAWSTWGGSYANSLTERKLRLYPEPNATEAMTIMLKVSPAVMKEMEDVPLIPVEFRRRVLCYDAAARKLLHDGGGSALRGYEVLAREAQAAISQMRVAHASFRAPTGRVENSTWNIDLHRDGYSFWEDE